MLLMNSDCKKTMGPGGRKEPERKPFSVEFRAFIDERGILIGQN